MVDTPPSKDLTGPFDDLRKGLVEAASLLSSTDEHHGRLAAIRALTATVQFFTNVPTIGDQGLNVPLVRLLDALTALDSGETKLLLKAVKKAGRAPASPLDEAHIGGVVFTVRQLHQLGISMTDATIEVAKAMAAAGAVKSRGTSRAVTARTIRTWIERVDADVGRHGQAAQTFDLPGEQNPFSNLSPSASDADKRKFLLERLQSMTWGIRADK